MQSRMASRPTHLGAVLFGTLIAALVTTSGCSLLNRAATPEALRELVKTFYRDATAGPQPDEQYSGAKVTPTWWQLPLDQHRLISGEISSVDAGQTPPVWYRWDIETSTATALSVGQRPALEVAAEPATLALPSGLSGPERVRVAVSREGRWSAFAAQAGELGWGIYLIDLTAPATYGRVAAGSSPQWQITG